ncbi:MAG: hypothetical protein LAQ69_30865 [Acidobacteriia bacterium]|nr:hypothetical protein [Terriglobia bacterium]
MSHRFKSKRSVPRSFVSGTNHNAAAEEQTKAENPPGDMLHRILNSEGERVHCKLDAFEASHFVVAANYADLVRSINYAVANQRALRALSNRRALYAFQADNLRLVHNFVAGAFSFRDHTWALMRELSAVGDPLMREYEQKVAEVFADSLVAGFVQDLRNWSVHRGILPVAFQSTYNVGRQEFVSSLVFSLDTLRSWKGWNSRAKKFLATLDESPELMDVFSRYFSDVESFYSWLVQRIRQTTAVQNSHKNSGPC